MRGKMSVFKTLDELSSVDWGKLIHAYGPAEDVPNLLRQLASDEKTIREKALWNLFGNIFHQGTRYQASSHAVPFLYGLLQRTGQKDRAEIVRLLLSLALGYEEEFLPDPFVPDTYREELRHAAISMTEEQRNQNAQYGYSPDYLLEVYDAVRDGAHIFISFLKDDDKELRDISAYSLGWMPELVESSFPALHQALIDETDSSCAATIRMSMGLIGKSCDRVSELQEIIGDNLQSSDLLTRASTAIALAKRPLSESLMPILIECLCSADELNQAYNGNVNDGSISSYASLFCVVSSNTGLRSDLVRALTDALQAANPIGSIDIACVILKNLADWYGSFDSRGQSSISELECAGLMAIVEYGAWTSGGYTFVNFSSAVESFGLPGSKEKLIHWITVPSERNQENETVQNQLPQTQQQIQSNTNLGWFKRATNFFRK